MSFVRRVMMGALLALSLWGCGGSERPPDENPPPQGPIRLAERPAQSNIEAFKADDEAIYYLTSIPPSGPGPHELIGTLHRAIAGQASQTPTVVVESSIRDFLIGPTHLYYFSYGRFVETPMGSRRMGTLNRVPKAGGAPEQLAEGLELIPNLNGMVLVGQHLYWLGSVNSVPSALYRTTADTPGPIEQIATSTSSNPFNLMASATHLYWTEERRIAGSGSFENALLRVPLSATSATAEDVIVWPNEARWNIASSIHAVVTPNGVFGGFGVWPERNLVRLPLEPGQGPITIVEALPNDISGLVAHDGMLYYNPRLGMGMWRRPIAGGEPETLMPNRSVTGRLAVSRAGIFFPYTTYIEQLPH